MKKQICVFKPATEYGNGVTARVRAYIGIGTSLSLTCSCRCVDTRLPGVQIPRCLVWLRRSCSGGEKPIIGVRWNREEVAEPEGQAVPGGTALVKHFSRSTAPFPQVRLILSAIPPGRAARCAQVGHRLPGADAIELLPPPGSHSSFLMPTQVPCARGRGWYFSLMWRHLPFPLAILLSPCSQALRDLSKSEPLDLWFDILPFGFGCSEIWWKQLPE